MKEMQARSEFKVHHSIVFLHKYDKSNNKFLLSLGYDDQYDQTSPNPISRALIFKIWEFTSLDSKISLSLSARLLPCQRHQRTYRRHHLGEDPQRPAAQDVQDRGEWAALSGDHQEVLGEQGLLDGCSDAGVQQDHRVQSKLTG
jgi:hypothetical protein